MSGWRFTAKIPAVAGNIVSVAVFQDWLYIACQWKVYVLENDTLIEIVAVAKPEGV